MGIQQKWFDGLSLANLDVDLLFHLAQFARPQNAAPAGSSAEFRTDGGRLHTSD
jgi:hypothetical protein